MDGQNVRWRAEGLVGEMDGQQMDRWWPAGQTICEICRNIGKSRSINRAHFVVLLLLEERNKINKNDFENGFHSYMYICIDM